MRPKFFFENFSTAQTINLAELLYPYIYIHFSVWAQIRYYFGRSAHRSRNIEKYFWPRVKTRKILKNQGGAYFTKICANNVISHVESITKIQILLTSLWFKKNQKNIFFDFWLNRQSEWKINDSYDMQTGYGEPEYEIHFWLQNTFFWKSTIFWLFFVDPISHVLEVIIKNEFNKNWFDWLKIKIMQS